MRISDWSSDVCSSDRIDRLTCIQLVEPICHGSRRHIIRSTWRYVEIQIPSGAPRHQGNHFLRLSNRLGSVALGVLECLVENTLNHRTDGRLSCGREVLRSEEHTSELQSLMRISFAFLCLKKKTYKTLTSQ